MKQLEEYTQEELIAYIGQLHYLMASYHKAWVAIYVAARPLIYRHASGEYDVQVRQFVHVANRQADRIDELLQEYGFKIQ